MHGGCIAKTGSCKMGFNSAREFIEGIDVRKKGFELTIQKVVKKIKIRLAVKVVFLIKCCCCFQK